MNTMNAMNGRGLFLSEGSVQKVAYDGFELSCGSDICISPLAAGSYVFTV